MNKNKGFYVGVNVVANPIVLEKFKSNSSKNVFSLGQLGNGKSFRYSGSDKNARR